ncbi:MAG: 16S rRNA (cytosine(1402)-N(4))-methyltransferase RsmH [Bacilli bacterium]
MIMHKSVLFDEVLDGLNIIPSGKYIDATLGYGGHASGVLNRLDKKGFLFAFDQDTDAINFSKKRLSEISENFMIIKSNFKDMKKYIDVNVDGIMFDLGVSSPQLDETSRGFSFHTDALLDMRMDKENNFSAYNVVNEYSLEKLTEIFYLYGEEKNAKAIAKAIIRNRPINTTLELAELIKGNVPISYRNASHPARKVFQAIRIEVNHELEILESSLLNAFDLLNSGGRICVITFHSLEDRIVKNVFKKLSSEDENAINLPIVPEELKAKAKLINKKPITASEEELNINNRSRSAKLRIIEKL